MAILPDRLDCLISWAISNYNLGQSRSLSGVELIELVNKWDDGFFLNPEQCSVLRSHSPSDLEWVQVVVPGLWQILCDPESQDWGSEALHHIAEILSQRAYKVGLFSAQWGQGTKLALSPDGSSRPLLDILSEGFPKPLFF
jgi:hypothetical protein